MQQKNRRKFMKHEEFFNEFLPSLHFLMGQGQVGFYDVLLDKSSYKCISGMSWDENPLGLFQIAICFETAFCPVLRRITCFAYPPSTIWALIEQCSREHCMGGVHSIPDRPILASKDTVRYIFSAPTNSH